MWSRTSVERHKEESSGVGPGIEDCRQRNLGKRTGILIKLGFAEVLHNIGDGLNGPIPAPRDQRCWNKTSSAPACPGYISHATHILKLPPTKNWRPMVTEV